jgi:hypothetical protein
MRGLVRNTIQQHIIYHLTTLKICISTVLACKMLFLDKMLMYYVQNIRYNENSWKLIKLKGAESDVKDHVELRVTMHSNKQCRLHLEQKVGKLRRVTIETKTAYETTDVCTGFSARRVWYEEFASWEIHRGETNCGQMNWDLRLTYRWIFYQRSQ